MAITELLLPTFKTDPSSIANFAFQAPSLFAHFRGVRGLQSFFRGRIVAENGEAVDGDSGRGVLILEWDDISSFHSFYPDSPTFQAFLAVAKQFVTEREYPELFGTITSSVPCAEASVTQIVKVLEGPETEEIWNRLRALLEGQGFGAGGFSSARGIEEQRGYFLGMVGWQNLEDYERSRTSVDVVGALRELGAGGVILDLVVQMERIAV
ncbi:uncharacterized protein DSM5745_04386 [Aspergillus mulundensis]|uniref:ABM domain-containing protein n=1 Tax=Aspergillus mulundensis TaxID=1810919 RepID=A0A3D8SCJ3_9EURO|nr:Uncharacterized protein DSM5745_04386 [Aspergillus mulundensis]RDW84060.1 Uncharacterized protein DSM5745_04386 [Aspergillus mulundensis]